MLAGSGGHAMVPWQEASVFLQARNIEIIMGVLPGALHPEKFFKEAGEPPR